MEALKQLILGNEPWLMSRLLNYAKERDYVKYTSTLLEAWRISVAGLSQMLVDAVDSYEEAPELGPDDAYTEDPIASFGILEAQRHRARGLTLSMFLGMIKYYRQAYVDLIEEASLSIQQRASYRYFVDRCFDRLEIGLCTEWASATENDTLRELQDTNRYLANEKNKYLTIFESLHDPVILLDSENRLVNMNHAAAGLFSNSNISGNIYYGQPPADDHVLVWLKAALDQLAGSTAATVTLERSLETHETLRHFHIKLERMLDVSEKFNGVVVLLNDLTERKQADEALHAAHEGLEMQVAKRTAELVTVNRRLQQEVIERGRAEFAIGRQLQELVFLHALAATGAAANNEHELLDYAFSAIDDMFDVDCLGMLLLDETRGALQAHPRSRMRAEAKEMTIPLAQGIIGRVATTGQLMRIADVSQVPACVVTDSDTRSVLCVPLEAGERVVGVINAESRRLDAFSPDDERLLGTFASQLATAMERVRLINTLENRVISRTQELSALYDVTAIASMPVDLDQVLVQALNRVLEAVRSPAGNIQLVDEEGAPLRMAARQIGVADESNQTALAATSSVGGPLAAWVATHNQPLVLTAASRTSQVPDLGLDDFEDVLARERIIYVGTPMRAAGRIVGVLSVFRTAYQDFDPEEVSLLASVADGLGLAVENSRRSRHMAVIEERERLAHQLHDSVTQSLYSLTLFSEWAQDLLASGQAEATTERLTRIGEVARQALKEMRLMLYELRGSPLGGECLSEVLEGRLAAVEERAGVRTHLLIDEALQLPKAMEDEFYYVIKEALNNSLKHASATSVTVCLFQEADEIVLEISDDGVGFEVANACSGGGMGLNSMETRTERLGGRFEIKSDLGAGTTVRVVVKIPVEA